MYRKRLSLRRYATSNRTRRREGLKIKRFGNSQEQLENLLLGKMKILLKSGPNFKTPAQCLAFMESAPRTHKTK